jgi:hypothetical protein
MMLWAIAIAVTILTLGLTVLVAQRLASRWGSVVAAVLSVIAAFAWREIWGLNDANSIASMAILLGSISLHYSLFRALRRPVQ